MSYKNLKSALPLLFMSVCAQAVAEGDFTKNLPPITLPDPAGVTHDLGHLQGSAVAVLFSIPNMTDGHEQQHWANAIGSAGSHPLSDSVKFFLIEDMTQSAFSGMARWDLKKEYKAGDRPVPLIDDEGSSRAAFGIPKGETVLLLYNAQHELVHSVVGDASSEAVEEFIAAVSAL